MSVATLDPPPQMAALHADFAEGTQAFAAALADHERALAPAATIEEYQRILDTYGESAGFEAAYERYAGRMLPPSGPRRPIRHRRRPPLRRFLTPAGRDGRGGRLL